MTNDVCTLHQGRTPLLLSLPHVGTAIPADQEPRYVERALGCEDTDWHLERLYAFAHELGASVLVPRYSRYLIDLNRPPENAPMYPGVNNTELCPTRFFSGDALYKARQEPDNAEAARRIRLYWRPYHDALNDELQRLRAAHGHAVLFDGHSIRSQLPWLFQGRLWDLNLGTAEGRSCAPELRLALATLLAGQARYTQVVDGRFKGGHITRHYGRPEFGIHAVQLEMCWSCYLDEDDPQQPWRWSDARAKQVQPLLRQMLQTILDWRP
jgi:N-formylglutamate deformylase